MQTQQNQNPIPAPASAPAPSPSPSASENYDPQVGATDELSLRVSTAVLTKTIFTHPDTGEEMLVLERKCTAQMLPDGQIKTHLAAQPLGGGSRLLDPAALINEVGKFNYDSEESAREGDLRIQIRPADWEQVKSFCIRHFSDASAKVVEANPSRELAEEFGDALGKEVKESAYCTRNVGVIEQAAKATARIGVDGKQTVRVFNIYEVTITDRELIADILDNSKNVSGLSLNEAAVAQAQANGKKGKATALLALPTAAVVAEFDAREPGSSPWQNVTVNGNTITDSVAAVLCEDITGLTISKWQA